MDLASLAIKLDASSADPAAAGLDKVVGAADRAEAGAKKVTTATGAMNASMRQAESAYAALTKVMAVVGIGAIAADIARVNAEFQSLTASLKVATGSMAGASAAMADIRKFAAETPFALSQSVEAFIKLKNLGLTPSIEAMRSYGNTASSMGKDLMQMVEAVADAATGEFERLKEFGIKASKSGENVAFTFQGVTTTVKATGSEIERYLTALGNTKFAGAMAEQMGTLSGQFSNARDQLDALYVSIGQLGANNILVKAMELAGEAIKFTSDNLETIVRLLGAGAVAFGTYTVATVAATAATTLMSGSFGVWAGTIATAYTQLGILAAAEIAATSGAVGLAAGVNSITAAMARNPIGIFAVALAAVASALFFAKTRTEELTAAQEAHAQSTRGLDGITASLTSATSTLANATGAARVEALKHVQALKAQAEAALQAATAQSILASTQAFAASQKAKAALAARDPINTGIDNLFGLSGSNSSSMPVRKAVAEAERLTKAANEAGASWREAETRVAGFRAQIEAATKPIAVASSGLTKIGSGGSHAAKGVAEASRAEEELARVLDGLNATMVTAFENVLAKNADALAKAASGADGFSAALKAANDNTDAMQKPILDAAKATAEWNESLRRTVNYLDQLGGFGSKLGNLGALFEGLRTGDFSSVGGKLGAFAGLFTQTDGGKALVSELRDVLDHTFGGNGQFTKKIDDALKGAGLGLASAQMVFGSGGTNVGSGIGGALGQGLGKALGPAISKAVGGTLGKALGSAAGPLGAIAGGILGNLIGGLFSKTKKASATIGLSGDGLGISGLTGNNSTLRSGASSAANSVIEALMNIADQFGAGIGGSISTSIGIRKKSYRVDTTGQGRVQGAGVLDFGEDAQAALKAAIQDAISDGVFTGLSDGVNRLLKGDGDLEAQLKKALSYQGVFDELKQRKDPTGYAMEQVDKWRAGMDKIFAEAGATSDDLAKLEELTGLKRTEILAQANEKALELANDRKQLEIQIMELEGKSTEALAAARELEKAGVDATLRPLYDRIYALQDEAAATAEAAAKAKEIADERLGLEGQLLQVLGDTAEIRARELAALDPSNRAIQQRIWQIEAQQAADEALNAHTKAVLDEQYGLVTQLLNLQGDTNKLRARELAALDPVNRSILEQIFALTDLKAAQDDAAKAAQEAAQVQKAIADERYGLETQLLNLLGDTATIRARELALLDPSNRALQQRIWAITDAQAAEEARVKAMQEAGRAEIKAREDQIASINDTISALSGATERWSGLAKEIREFRAGLFSGTVGSGTSYKQSEAEFQRVSKMAAFGDVGALQSFTGVSKAFLDAARDNARSLVDYQRAIGLVAGAADAAAAGADGVARQAADQIAVLMAQRIELETLNAQTQASLETLNASADVQANNVVPTLEQMVKEQQAASDDASKARAEQKVENLAMVTALNQIARILDRVSQGGESFTVATDGNSLSVTVESSAAAPVHVVTP